ncbi:hypothetical protein GNI_132520 [Gregarina niphandrodes]|uniref:Uncharacterized protein n=1 Tax=Gregarina niphandrodes TaxID=110365 RepID=A0A023B1A3_GRENI|nr:hypothetical protein GNI_132520 [Gregarina niphandrodes]EZG46945.1 hypothetical protein GNI_132520 [Gregarina niphandrodes]|eukprot:XP_011132220.1 hypothetical protein GNI_132520 [Gregarina niphandrodes]
MYRATPLQFPANTQYTNGNTATVSLNESFGGLGSVGGVGSIGGLGSNGVEFEEGAPPEFSSTILSDSMRPTPLRPGPQIPLPVFDIEPSQRIGPGVGLVPPEDATMRITSDGSSTVFLNSLMPAILRSEHLSGQEHFADPEHIADPQHVEGSEYRLEHTGSEHRSEQAPLARNSLAPPPLAPVEEVSPEIASNLADTKSVNGSSTSSISPGHTMASIETSMGFEPADSAGSRRRALRRLQKQAFALQRPPGYSAAQPGGGPINLGQATAVIPAALLQELLTKGYIPPHLLAAYAPSLVGAAPQFRNADPFNSVEMHHPYNSIEYNGNAVMGSAVMGNSVTGNGMMGNGMMGNGMMGNGMMGNGMMGSTMMGSTMMGNGMMGHAMMRGPVMGMMGNSVLGSGSPAFVNTPGRNFGRNGGLANTGLMSPVLTPNGVMSVPSMSVASGNLLAGAGYHANGFPAPGAVVSNQRPGGHLMMSPGNSLLGPGGLHGTAVRTAALAPSNRMLAANPGAVTPYMTPGYFSVPTSSGPYADPYMRPQYAIAEYNRSAANWMAANGMPASGMPVNGMPVNGIPPKGMIPNGMCPNGMGPNGMPPNGMAALNQSTEWLMNSTEVRRKFPRLCGAIARGGVNLVELLTHEVVVPVEESINVDVKTIMSRKAVGRLLGDRLRKAFKNRLPDPAIESRLVNKIAGYIWAKIEKVVAHAEDEQTLLAWLFRQSLETHADLSHSFTLASRKKGDIILAKIEGTATITRSRKLMQDELTLSTSFSVRVRTCLGRRGAGGEIGQVAHVCARPKN